VRVLCANCVHPQCNGYDSRVATAHERAHTVPHSPDVLLEITRHLTFAGASPSSSHTVGHVWPCLRMHLDIGRRSV
jgi:hypothetical protein